MTGKHFVDKIIKLSLAHFCSQFNGFMYFYQMGIIQFTINHLFALS